MHDEQAPFDPCNAPLRDERLHRFSHALKNRLGSLWQAAAMLHDLPEGPERAQLLAMAEKNYFNGARELEGLMDDFSVPRGISKLHRAPVELKGLLEQCIGNVAFRTEKKNQHVSFQADDAISMDGDRQVLEQLFEALLSNASKFSPKGSTIEVTAKCNAGDVLVEVKDQGVGLTEEDLQEVFTRYAILSSRSTDGESQARSTLARAKQWAEAHGGDLTAACSGTGRGCSFSVRLPRG